MSDTKLVHGRYRPLKKLHRGALGEVFLVQDMQLERPLMLESILGPPLAEGAKLPPAAARRLKEDIEGLAALQSPGLIALLDLQFAGRPPCIVYEPVAGESLVKWVSQSRPRGAALPAALEDAARPLLEALGAVHGQGLVHKDVRPANVIRKPSGEPVLMEPGVALAGGELELLHPSYRTPLLLFLAPEVLRGEPATAASDMYQLGALLRFVATGAPPFPSPDDALAAAREGRAPPPLRQASPGLRDAWCQFVDELMAPRVAGRIASVAAAEEFLDLMLLEEAEQEGLLPGTAPGTGSGLPPPPENPRPLWLTLLPVVLICLLAGGGLWYAMGAGAEGATLTGEIVTGLETLELRFEPADEGGALPDGTRLVLGEGQEQPLTEEDGRLVATVPWKSLAGRVYRVLGAGDELLASGNFPEGYAAPAGELLPSYSVEGELGAVGFRVDANREVTLEVSWKVGDEARSRRSDGGFRRTAKVVLEPGPEEVYEELSWRMVGRNGDHRPLPGPRTLTGAVPFMREAAKAARDLLPSEWVKETLRPAVEKAQDAAVDLEFPRWEELRQAWLEDSLFQRLRKQGPRLIASSKVEYQQRANLYDALLGIDRANTVVVALSAHAPIEVRGIFAPFCRAFDPQEIRGTLALSSGQGALMMQYAGAPPSFINEDGAKRWSDRIEKAYVFPEELLQEGKSVRFTVAVEDISPLYRMELRVTFPQEEDPDDEGGGLFDLGPRDPSVAYWFYPRRNFFEVLEARNEKDEQGDVLERSHKMAIEIPASVIEQPNVKLSLRVDKLGIWGGHGATTLVGLFVGEGTLSALE